MGREPRTARDKLRQARAEVYRRHILEAAERVFADKGFASASMQEIGRQAGVSMGTIYSVFASKEAVLEGVLQWRGEEILALVRDATASAAGALEALRRLMEAYVTYFTAHPDFLRMHLRLGGAWSVSPANGKRRAAVWEEIHRLQADLMGKGVREGVLVDEDPALLARLFSAVDQVLLARWVELGLRASKEELLRQLQLWVERLLVRRPNGPTSGQNQLAHRQRVQR